MSGRKATGWSRLDNAAKIFPPTSSRSDPKVFRFSCELYEQVEPEALQAALDLTLESFPHLRSVLRRGLFWYYLDSSSLQAQVEEEHLPPCAPLYDPARRGLLFRVFYYRRRIGFEVYHALTDGTGALQFLRMLVYHYLTIRHRQAFPDGLPPFDYDASTGQASDDSFRRYYGDHAASAGPAVPPRPVRAHHLTGARLPEYRLRVLEAECSAKEVVGCARARGVTVTGLLAGMLFCAVNEEMTVRERRRPVVLTIPVNLRKYFSSESARNFFGIVNLSYRFDRPDADFEEVLKVLTSEMSAELTPERLAGRMQQLSALEHNMLTRLVPLAFKDLSLRIADRVSKRGVTGALSNLGRVEMPAELHQYIRLFDVFNSTNRLQVCACSFGDRMMVSCTSPLVSADLYKRFFRSLGDLGVGLTIHSNQPEEE